MSSAHEFADVDPVESLPAIAQDALRMAAPADPERMPDSGRLLSDAARVRRQARAESDESGTAWLRPGGELGAVVIPAGIPLAALGRHVLAQPKGHQDA